VSFVSLWFKKRRVAPRVKELVVPRLGKLDPAEVRAIGIEMRIRRG
jgi:hypothetical protein